VTAQSRRDNRVNHLYPILIGLLLAASCLIPVHP
jgi:hypothetical protein